MQRGKSQHRRAQSKACGPASNLASPHDPEGFLGSPPSELGSNPAPSANFAELRIDSLCYEEPLLIPLEPTTNHGKPVSCELVSGDPHLV